MTAGAFGTLDIVVTIGYLATIVTLGCIVGVRSRRKGSGAGDYFLAGKTLKWPMIGMALFATNISCVHLVSLAQAGFDEGLLQGNFEWMAAVTLLLLSFFFAPFYIRSRVATLPDFLEKRYGRACRDWLTVLSMVSAVTIHIGFALLTGAIVLEGMFGIPPAVSIVVLCVLTALYVIIGGLMAVVFTETVETVVLLAGAIMITAFAWIKVGGWGGMVAALDTAKEAQMLHMLRPAGDASNMPWFAILLGYPVLGIWYWCADQTIVQRVLGAKDENHARVGPLFAGLIKVLPVFVFVLPGLMFYAILDRGLLPGVQVTNSKEVYATMINTLLPVGAKGVMAAALIAALMSTVSGALNSISTLFSYDLVKRFRPATTDRQLVLIGRLAALGAMLLAIGLIPVLNRYDSLFRGVNDVIAHIAPPVTTVFLLGVFWPRASATGAKLTLWFGSTLGIVVFAMNKIAKMKEPLFAVPDFLANPPGGFMMMAFWLFCACTLMLVGFSLAFPKTPQEDPEKLYWAKPFDSLRFKGWSGIGNYKFLGILLLAAMATLYYFFG